MKQTGTLLILLLVAVPALGQETAEAGAGTAPPCVLSSIELDQDPGDSDGGNATLRLAVEGVPASLGARIEQPSVVALALAGCAPRPQLADRSFAAGLVSGLKLTARSTLAGPVTAVTVTARQPFEYSVSSVPGTVRLRLTARAGAIEESGDPIGPEAMPAPPISEPKAALIRVREPLPRPKPMVPLSEASEQPAVAESPAPPPTAPPPAVDAAALVAAVEGWAQAWSEQRVDDYLATYAATFLPPGGADRDAWEAERRLRLTVPRFITVELEGLRVLLHNPSRPEASFWQSYTSDRFSDRVYKTQIWIEEDGGWKILEERVVEPPEIMRELPDP